MQDSTRDKDSLLSSLRSQNDSNKNLSVPKYQNSYRSPRKLGSNEKGALKLEKLYSNLLNNLSKDAANFRNKTRLNSKENPTVTNSSDDSVLTFTEKKSKRVNRSMENNERTLNSSLLMDLNDQDSPKKRNEKILQKSNNLYLQSQKKKEKFNLKLQEYEKIKLEKEQEDCTFKPKINKYTNYNKKKSNLYERNKKWKDNNSEKIEKTKQISENMKLTECSFQPTINQKTISTANETITKDRDTLKYINRLNNAKKKKEEKSARLNPDYNTIYDKLFPKNKGPGVVLITETNQNTSEYSTFNPNRNKNDYHNCRKKLKEELNSLVLSKNEENH